MKLFGNIARRDAFHSSLQIVSATKQLFFRPFAGNTIYIIYINYHMQHLVLTTPIFVVKGTKIQGFCMDSVFGYTDADKFYEFDDQIRVFIFLSLPSCEMVNHQQSLFA